MGQESRSKTVRRQVRLAEEQLRLPLVGVLMNVRADMMEVVITAGMKVVEAMLEEDRIGSAARSTRGSQAARSRAAAP
jgi:hypothetical protein